MTKTLLSWGFKIKPYDWCVANKMVNGQQLTVVWHVDDIKTSHVDENVVSTMISKLNERYGKTASGQSVPLTVKRGKNHEFLGMTLDYSSKGKVRIWKNIRIFCSVSFSFLVCTCNSRFRWSNVSK